MEDRDGSTEDSQSETAMTAIPKVEEAEEEKKEVMKSDDNEEEPAVDEEEEGLGMFADLGDDEEETKQPVRVKKIKLLKIPFAI